MMDPRYAPRTVEWLSNTVDPAIHDVVAAIFRSGVMRTANCCAGYGESQGRVRHTKHLGYDVGPTSHCPMTYLAIEATSAPLAQAFVADMDKIAAVHELRTMGSAEAGTLVHGVHWFYLLPRDRVPPDHVREAAWQPVRELLREYGLLAPPSQRLAA